MSDGILFLIALLAILAVLGVVWGILARHRRDNVVNVDFGAHKGRELDKRRVDKKR